MLKILLKNLALLLCCTTVLFWSLPVRAETQIDPNLEKQVLQIIRKNPQVLIESVQAYQAQQQAQQQQQQVAYLEKLGANPQEAIDANSSVGNPQAKIILLEFSDFQCPYCSKAKDTVKEFISKHKKDVLLVYKHYPLISIHPQALPAAKAALAASKQGKFWEYHDALFANQKSLSEELYLKTAKDLKLNIDKFERDRQTADSAIAKDVALAENLGISGTPFFVILAQAKTKGYGETFSGAVPITDFEAAYNRMAQKLKS
jgi:protein-disulfide isomerase